MSVNRKFPEYVILVNPTTLQPYVASGGGGGISSSVSLLDDLGNPINGSNPLPVTGTVTVGSLPSVTIASLPALPAGSNLIGKVDINSLPALSAGSAAIGSVTVTSLPALPAGANLIGSVNIANSPSVTISGTVTPANVTTADYDTGAGTVTQTMLGIALPASGGPVPGGTVANPLVVSVGNTPSVSVSGSVTVTGTVTANQGGTWTVAQGGAPWSVSQSGTWDVTGAVTQSGTWNVTVNAALPTGANVIGAVTQSGTWTVAQGGSPWGVKTEAQLDYDTGAGTQNLSLVGLALPASGGAVAGGTATNPFTVTGTVAVSGSVTVAGTVTANQGGAPWSVSPSGTWNVTVNAALPTGANVIGAVTQSGTWTVAQGGAPWSVSQSGTWNVTVNTALPTGANTIGAVTQSGTWNVTVNGALPTGANVIGGVTQSGTWTVQTGSILSTVATRSSVGASTSSLTLLAANANRIGALIYNDSSKLLYLALGTGASTTNYTTQMPGGSLYEVPFSFTGIITGVWAATNGNARVTELT